MTARARRIAAPAPQRAAPAAPAPRGLAGVLALQRSAGNAAVTRLLRVPGTQTAPTARERFEARLRARWGVASVRAGTEADQIAEMRRMTPSDESSPTSITGWQSWDPGSDSPLYDDILAAFEAMGSALGGIPEVRDVRFQAVDYNNVEGNARAFPHNGATYGSGLLNVFAAIQQADWPLPAGRSTSAAPAAATVGSAAESHRRILIHELAHGVFERFGDPNAPGGSPQLFSEWAAAGGWTGGRLEQNGTVLTASNWNRDWPEQPVSAYATRNLMEDFAESLMCFVVAPEVLRARSPARHAFIVSRLGAWRSGLRAAAS
jgi:hypothetical protein